MVEWASSASERTFNQSAPNGKKEPTLPVFSAAANVWYREASKKTAKFSAYCDLATIVLVSAARPFIPDIYRRDKTDVHKTIATRTTKSFAGMSSCSGSRPLFNRNEGVFT